MAENCQEAIWECQAQGGLLIGCYEHPEGIEWDCELPPPAPWQEDPPPVVSPDPRTTPPPAKKASMVPYVIGGVAVLGIGYYLLK